MYRESLSVVGALLAAAAVGATAFIAADVAATLLSPAEGDTPAFVWWAAQRLWLAAFIVALAHAVILGLPAFLVLRWRGWTRWWTSLIAGFAIGALPYAVFFFPAREEPGSFNQVGSHVLMDNGATTLWGWIGYGEFIAGLGALGMAGGIAAWLTWHWLGRVRAAADT